MADSEVLAAPESLPTTEAPEEEITEPEMTHEQRKEEEQAVIQRHIERTEAQIEQLEQMESQDVVGGLSMQELEEMGIQITNVMEFSATIELSAPKDMSKMYNFTGVKSNLPRDDINLQFCRGVLKERRNMLEDLKISSIRRKSLLDPQTILLLKSQEESNIVNERTNFWRKAALTNQKEPKPQSERNPEWLADYQKNNLGIQQKTSEVFWKGVEVKSKEKAKTPELERTIHNKEKKKSKEEQWEVSLNDDSWYRAPTFQPEGTQSRRTDIEALCEIIYGYGERYPDGTAAIGFTWLFKMFNRANIVGILIKAKKHGLVFFDGEIVFASVRADDDDEFVVLQKPIGEIRRAFNEMRNRHSEMFVTDGRRRATICILNDSKDDTEDTEETEQTGEESDCNL